MRRLIAALAAVLAIGWLAAAPARAEDAFTPAQRAEIVKIMRDALKADPTILREAVATLQADDVKLQDAASRATIAKHRDALLRVSADPVAGNPSGDVTVVEFSDLRCPYCRRMVPVLADLLKTDPNVRLVYKDIPILGPASVLGAKAVLAAQRQTQVPDGYNRLHRAIMTGPANITDDSLREAASGAGLDWGRLRKDMDDPQIAARIQTNIDLAHAIGVEGTPLYVVGERMLSGAVELAELQKAVADARTALR